MPVDASLAPAVNGTETLTLTAPASYLHDPSTVYPVVIDPSSSVGLIGDTYVDSGSPTTTSIANASFWNDGHLKVGRLTDGSMRRSFLKFDVSVIPDGAEIVSATLTLVETWAVDCDPQVVMLKAVTGGRYLDAGTTWNSQPTLGQDVYARYNGPSLGGGVSCPGGSISLRNGGDAATPALADLVQQWVDGIDGDNLGVAVTADLSGSQAGKRFQSSNSADGPVLGVDYVPTEIVAFGGRAPIGAGQFQTPIAYPHFSTTGYRRGLWEIVAKGTWYVISGPAVAAAPVRLWLYRVYTGGTRTLIRTTDVVTGPRRWIPVVGICSPHTTLQYVAKIDVDLIGYTDPADRPETPARSVRCDPPGS